VKRASLARRCVRWSKLLLAACTLPVLAEALAPPVAMTRYDLLVDELATATEAAQRRFADAALEVLIEAHTGGLGDTSRADWRRGTRDYVARLAHVRAQLQRGAELQIVREARHAVRLIVADEQVMLTALYDGQQRELETAIADAVCTWRDCADTSPTVDEVVVAREQGLRGEWSLADRAPPLFAQEDGLHCAFEDARHLRLKQAACERVTRELRLVEEALRAILAHGGRIDWPALRVGAAVSAGGAGDVTGRRRVSYDESGRYFDLDLPLLAAAPEVLQGAHPWLQTRLRGQAAIYVITAPDRLAYRVPDTN
jgi:hypothetical protein